MLDEQTQKQKSDAQLAAAKKAKLARTRAAAKQATDAANKKWAAHARNDPGDWLYR